MKIVLVYILFLSFLPAYASEQRPLRLSDQAEITVVTIGPYQGEPWSAFGHSGLRVTDQKNNIDRFYNYGLYDFNQENFFLNFARGLLKYKVGFSHWHRVFAQAKHLNRYVKLQYLQLTQDQKQALFDYLQHNVQPENAEYVYHYVYDNCATKIRDVIQELYGRNVSFDLTYKQKGKTIRQLMDDYLEQQPWAGLVINVGLGMQVDIEMEAEGYMFLPPYIYLAFAGGTILQGDQRLPLIVRTEDAYIPTDIKNAKNKIFTPFNLFFVLFFIVGFITHRNMKHGKRTKWIDTLLFGFTGFVGCWVAYLWLGTEHMSKWNLNILWAIPLHFPLIFLINKSRFKSFFQVYFKMVGYWYCLVLLAWAILPQPLNMALVPLILAMVLRALYISYNLKNKR